MLSQLGVLFHTESPNEDEKRLRGEPASVYATRIAVQKAKAIQRKLNLSKNKSWATLAADTVVVHRKDVLGKPQNTADALYMLTRLSGQTHEVITGYCWLGHYQEKDRFYEGHERSYVSFSEKSLEFWKWYVSTGEPLDKAGSYAAQGMGHSFIHAVRGSYSNIIGLPLVEVLIAFKKTFGKELYELCRKTKGS